MNRRASAGTPPIYVETGRRIRDIRRAKGVSQERLAAAVGLSRTSITNIERGRQKILLHTLAEVASELGIPIHELVPTGGGMKSKLENQVPSDASPKLRKLISDIVQKKGSTTS